MRKKAGNIPRNQIVFAAETVYFSSGKPAYEQGQKVLLVFANDIVYVFHPDATQDAIRRGIGLLYTFTERPVEIDGRRVR